MQDAFWNAVDTDAPQTVQQELARHYYKIRDGLGGAQSPAKYGAFPQDPYSHTPSWGGAHQPGLTGQVKEDILCRWGELGIRITDGILRINPALLRRAEFCRSPEKFSWYDTHGNLKSLQLNVGALAFTYCQIPFVFHLSDEPLLKTRGEHTEERPELALSLEESAALFGRTGKLTRVDAYLTPSF